MRLPFSKPAQYQLMLSALFVAALSFITLAASFAEMPEKDLEGAVAINE